MDEIMDSGGVIVAKLESDIVVAAGSMLHLYEMARDGRYVEVEVKTTSTRPEDMTISEARKAAQDWLRELYNLGQGYRF